MVIDKENRIVSMNGIVVDLTGKEFDLLFFWHLIRGEYIQRNRFTRRYGKKNTHLMTITLCSKLRKKIEPDPEHPFYIQTVRGVGYRFNKEA